MDRVAQLLEQARDMAAAEGFGGYFGEDSFREGLEILVTSLDREAQLNEVGRMGTDAQIVDLLVNRLRIEGWYARHPEINEQEIVAPLIGIGLPRTGSTALACLLGEDPASRSLRTWESIMPCPPPDPATADSDPRIALAEASMQRRARMFPRMTAMLPSTATSPTECQLAMGYDFKSQIFQPFAHVPSYVEWLVNKADLVPTYRYVKRVLKLLQWRWPRLNGQWPSWRLKNPSHSLFITALNEVFADARFVMTHRDVGGVLPSVADLYSEMRRAFSDTVDMLALGRETSGFCELGMRRMIAFRDGGQDHRFFDIHFVPFQKDPFPSIEALYRFLGTELSAEARAGMERWRQSKPLAEQTYARTDPAEFGFDIPALRARFKFYSERFGMSEAAA